MLKFDLYELEFDNLSSTYANNRPTLTHNKNSILWWFGIRLNIRCAKLAHFLVKWSNICTSCCEWQPKIDHPEAEQQTLITAAGEHRTDNWNRFSPAQAHGPPLQAELIGQTAENHCSQKSRVAENHLSFMPVLLQDKNNIRSLARISHQQRWLHIQEVPQWTIVAYVCWGSDAAGKRTQWVKAAKWTECWSLTSFSHLSGKSSGFSKPNSRA